MQRQFNNPGLSRARNLQERQRMVEATGDWRSDDRMRGDVRVMQNVRGLQSGNSRWPDNDRGVLRHSGDYTHYTDDDLLRQGVGSGGFDSAGNPVLASIPGQRWQARNINSPYAPMSGTGNNAMWSSMGNTPPVKIKLSLIDVCLALFLFMPLQTLFCHGAWAFLDPAFSRSLTFAPSLVIFAAATSIQLAASFWQRRLPAILSRHVDEEKLPYVKRAYNYVIAVANVFHQRAIWEVYEALFGAKASTGGKMAGTVILTLSTFKCIRTLVGAPFSLELDLHHYDYGWTTFMKTQPDESARSLYDCCLTILGIYSLGHLFVASSWIAMTSSAPSNPLLAAVILCLIGYAGCILLMAISRHLQQYAYNLQFTQSPLVLLLFEDAVNIGYCLSSNALGLGWWLFFDYMSASFPIYYNSRNITPFCCNISAFIMLCFAYCSESLVTRSCERDGELPGGESLACSVNYLQEFLGDSFGETSLDLRYGSLLRNRMDGTQAGGRAVYATVENNSVVRDIQMHFQPSAYQTQNRPVQQQNGRWLGAKSA